MSPRFAGTLKFGAKALGGAAAVFLIVGALIVLTTNRAPKKVLAAVTAAVVPEVAAPPSLIVVGEKSERDSHDEQWLNGMVVSQTEKPYQFVQISYDLFDATGAQIGTASAATRGLAPHGRWLFKTVISGHCTRFKLSKLDGY
jgi:hypothetical protein